MIENPRYKNLYSHSVSANPISVSKTMVAEVYESKTLTKRRAKNKVARKARKVNKKNRRG